MRGNEQVVHQFRDIAGAGRADVHSPGRHRFEHRARHRKIDFLAADHHGQRTFRGAGRAAAHRRIEQGVTRLGQARHQAAGGAGIRGGGVDHHHLPIVPREQTALGRHHSFDVPCVRQREHKRIRALQNIGQRGQEAYVGRLDRGTPCLADVIAEHRETLAGERCGHAEPHVAQPDHTNCMDFHSDPFPEFRDRISTNYRSNKKSFTNGALRSGQRSDRRTT